jgi:APA family basic amino acid/polyamine antiporter
MYCYLGWNVAGYIASEIADPVRTLPRIMIGGTACVALVYLLLNLVYLYALPVTTLAEPPVLPVAEKAAAALWGPTVARWLAALLAVSIAGAVSAMVWAGPRVTWAMARDGVLTPWLARLHPRTHVPVRAIVLQSGWASLLILTGTFEQLVVYSGVVLAAFTALTVGTIFRLRHKAPHLIRPYRVPFYPWLPGLLIGGALGLVLYSVHQRPTESALGLATVLAGLPLYWWRKSQRQAAVT